MIPGAAAAIGARSRLGGRSSEAIQERIASSASSARWPQTRAKAIIVAAFHGTPKRTRAKSVSIGTPYPTVPPWPSPGTARARNRGVPRKPLCRHSLGGAACRRLLSCLPVSGPNCNSLPFRSCSVITSELHKADQDQYKLIAHLEAPDRVGSCVPPCSIYDRHMLGSERRRRRRQAFARA